jgi:dienelactone hydrolase
LHGLVSLGREFYHRNAFIKTYQYHPWNNLLRVSSYSLEGLFAKHRSLPALALISPGAGGSENGYRYLAEGFEADGWRAVVMGHKESGAAALRSDIRDTHGIKNGLRELVDDPQAYDARLMDISGALQWAEQSCKAPYVALIGHSMGARTVMIEAGAKNKIGVKGRDRFKAYVAMSPDGPDSVFPENAWNGIHKAMLILTGTRDKSMGTGEYKCARFLTGTCLRDASGWV